MNFTELPNDVLINILDNLEIPALLNILSTNSMIYNALYPYYQRKIRMYYLNIKGLDKIQNHLEDAIEFVNFSNDSCIYPDLKTKNKFITLLMNDLAKLDTIQDPERRNMIVAIQNILDQLENRYNVNDKPILLQPTIQSTRTSYLPINKDSYTALGKAFRH